MFVCTDSTEIFFSKLNSAGLNYNLPSFFTDSYCAGVSNSAGVSNKHCLLTFFILILKYSKTCLKRPLKRPKIGFQAGLSLNACQKYRRMLQENILQYFLPSLSYHLSLRSLFCLFLSGRLRQVLLYTKG